LSIDDDHLIDRMNLEADSDCEDGDLEKRDTKIASNDFSVEKLKD